MWQPVDGPPLEYRFMGHYRNSLEPNLQAVAGALLQELMSPLGSAVVEGSDNQQLRDALAQQMQRDDIVSGPPWQLTEKGYQYIDVCRRVITPKRVLKKPTGNLQDATVFEQSMELDDDGWSHKVLGKREIRKLKDEASYCLGQSPPVAKVWYIVAGCVVVMRLYLLALLTAPRGKEVKHFQSENYYHGVLGMPLKAGASSRRLIRPQDIIGEQEWPEDVVRARPCRWQTTRTRRRVRAAHSPELRSGGSSGKDSNARTGTSSSSSATTSSSTSSDNYGSESDTGGDDGGGADAETGEQHQHVEPDPAGRRPHAQRLSVQARNMEVSMPFGLNRFTMIRRGGEHEGWQMTCGHPKHNAGTACTKSRGLNFDGGEDACVRLLKLWALKGLQSRSKADHSAHWQGVLAAWTRGEVPAERDLDDLAWTDWGASAAAASEGLAAAVAALTTSSHGRRSRGSSCAAAAGVSASGATLEVANAPAESLGVAGSAASSSGHPGRRGRRQGPIAPVEGGDGGAAPKRRKRQ